VHVYTPAPKNKQKDEFPHGQLAKIKLPPKVNFPYLPKAFLVICTKFYFSPKFPRGYPGNGKTADFN